METNSNIQKLKQQLSEIDFYKQFPMMIPFIGDYYISTNHRRMLLVGESFYLPKSSTIHLDAKAWYQASENQLKTVDGEKGKKEDEKEWINCDGLLKCDWNSKGHKIYQELNTWIGKTRLLFKSRPIDEIAFTNFFVRPAIKGKSIKDYKKVDKEIDKEKANEIFKCVLNVLQPNIVIFVSKFAYECVDKTIVKNNKDMVVDYVVHPCSTCWHCNNAARGKIDFLILLEKHFVI